MGVISLIQYLFVEVHDEQTGFARAIIAWSSYPVFFAQRCYTGSSRVRVDIGEPVDFTAKDPGVAASTL